MLDQIELIPESRVEKNIIPDTRLFIAFDIHRYKYIFSIMYFSL